MSSIYTQHPTCEQCEDFDICPLGEECPVANEPEAMSGQRFSLDDLEAMSCGGYTSPVTGNHFPATSGHSMTSTSKGVCCRVCGLSAVVLRAAAEAEL